MSDQEYPFIPFKTQEFEEDEMVIRSKEFYQWSNKRRSVRHFSQRSVPKEVLENIILTASNAPSGANKQPWTFCLISNEKLKAELRKLAEEEEKKSYNGRMSDEWLEDLAHLGTNWNKEFIQEAPYLIIVMKRVYELNENGTKRNNYYVNESVGLACGFLLMAIHNAGLVALTHTPSPMNFISRALNRPENERPFLLIPVGYASDSAEVPDIKRKSREEVVEYYE